MGKIIEEIFEFIESWRDSNHYDVDEVLSENQIAKFIGELHKQISMMDFSLPEETTILGYTGQSNDTPVWKIMKQISGNLGDKAVYISDLPAGKLISSENSERLAAAINNITLDDAATSMIMSGYDSAGNRIGPNCGYGDYLSLDDFVSSKLMGECAGVSDNVIIFAPEELAPNKVFCTTKIERIFANDTFKFINGISKEELSALYYSGEAGRNSVYQIISATSREAVGVT